ncbi:PaaX family transcriptional regulator C-terminal domain-containing protein [Streptomyces sp. NPDC006516]|uniref:PaaX family transcriptional regulator C-terminal domain-containing protein n=1 Tax=Streptomyces sp. NPDC006516 TaxID=3154309 RepID=UPI0033B90C22
MDGGQALTTYLALIDHRRKLPFRDPGLPLEVLTDNWSGSAAVQLFERMVAILEGRAPAYAAPYGAIRPPADGAGATERG